MSEIYILRFKCKGKAPFTLTLEDARNITDLIRKHCVEIGDQCAMECLSDPEPAIAVSTKMPDGKFIMEVAINPVDIRQIRKRFKE